MKDEELLNLVARRFGIPKTVAGSPRIDTRFRKPLSEGVDAGDPYAEKRV